MRSLALLISAIFLASAGGPGVVQAQNVFPYPVEKVTLENGLDVLLVPMPEFQDVLSFNVLVLAGARNETEKGKTGFAHLFEHIMFRHEYEGRSGGYGEAMKKLGAFNNAWTRFDVTFYHPLTFTSNLDAVTLSTGEIVPGLLELEASRFTSLDFDEKIFTTETGAVMGEYRKSATSPGLAMAEKQLELAYPVHPYGHTTIGYYEDVENMSLYYEYARWFYDTYYRPNNCILVIAGDFTKAELLPKLTAAFGPWEAKQPPAIDVQDPPQKAELRGHVAWDADVPPRVNVAYKGPRFSTGSKETAVGQILGELLASRSAPLYRKLRFEKKTVSSLDLGATEGFDRRLVEIEGQLYADQYGERGEPYLEETIRDIIQGFAELSSFASQENAAEILETVKSKYTYDFLAALDSPANVAETLANYYRFERDPEAIDKLVASVRALTPADIEAYARQYFVDDNRVIVTMAPKGS
ncbi:MAG: pitrilysin family protein [Candidatus Neomarinimicrobiota bacterium]